MVIHFGQAERCLRQKSWKVAFEPKNPESRLRHKFFRLVHVTGHEAFEFICIYMLRCKRRWYSANSPFRSVIGRAFFSEPRRKCLHRLKIVAALSCREALKESDFQLILGALYPDRKIAHAIQSVAHR